MVKLLKNQYIYQYNYKFSFDKFFEAYLKGPRIFDNRGALKSSFQPDELPHRDSQIRNIVEKVACALLGDEPPSFICYGNAGTGKTSTIRYIEQKLAQ